MRPPRRKSIPAAGVAAIVIISGSAYWYHTTHRYVPVSEGYGGVAPAGRAKTAEDKRHPTSLRHAVDAYDKGDYRQAEAEAERVVEKAQGSRDPGQKKLSVQAREIMAFSAARRKDMALARDRFAQMTVEAAKLPDKGKQEAEPGLMEPTLTEEGAYQHAVCTAALGDKKGAEQEYMRFMRDYPESPLITGAAKRIALLHGKHMPKYAEKAWTQAMEVAKQRDLQRRKDAAVCGPECLAEMLRRRGENPDLKSLAKEMKTDENGTSLQSLSVAAKRHGFNPVGLALTDKGLRQQPLPLIALVFPGHFVIVDKIDQDGLTVCDPTMSRAAKPTTRQIPWNDWHDMWRGTALTLGTKIASVGGG